MLIPEMYEASGITKTWKGNVAQEERAANNKVLEPPKIKKNTRTYLLTTFIQY